MEDPPDVSISEIDAPSSQEEEVGLSKLKEKLYRVNEWKKEAAILEKELETLQSKLIDDSPLLERKLKKRGCKPDPKYVAKLAKDIKENWKKY